MTLDPTHRAAGILFRAPDGSALFLKRGPGDYPGYWCFPGGHLENGEGPEQAATREAIEEIGFLPKGKREALARSISVQEFVAAPAAAMPGGTVGAEALPVPAVPKVVDCTTFLQDVAKPFEPERDAEHVGHAWSPLTSPPEPLHPGCRVAIDRLFADELGVARMMAADALTSPQVYKNVTLWAMRITGTGIAYRRPVFKMTKDGKVELDADKKPIIAREEEFPWRDPGLYLNDEFLARCNGLPVIWQHPDKATLDSKEHARRVVGSVFLPYIKGDEVWGIAKIYDDEANGEMRSKQLSTSPAVVLSDPESPSYKFRLDDGPVLLVEGKPSLLDHLAICERGVWDKGGEAAGITNHDLEENEDMPEAVKTDAVTPTLADVMAALGGIAVQVKDIGARVDSMEDKMDSEKSEDEKEKERKDAEEKEKADAEKMKADAEEKAKKDAEEKEKGEPEKVAADAKKDADEKAKKDAEEKEKADAACMKADAEKALAENKTLKTRLDAFERRLPKDRSDSDYGAMSSAQARADSVYNDFGKQAPRFLNGEEVLDYRRRLVEEFKQHSPAWAKVDLATLPDTAFEIAETAIYADAVAAAKTPGDLADGGLRMVRGKTPSGHNETKFYGRASAWMSRFSGSRRYATAINPNPKREAV